MTLSRFLSKRLLQPKTEHRKVFRKVMKLYKGDEQWETVTNVKVSGQMSNGRKTFVFDNCSEDYIYMMFRDGFNGEYLTAV